MRLEDTISLMTSDDFKDRTKAEYLQLKIRHENLSKLLKRYREGTLDFVPNCSYDLLHTQLVYMECYMNALEESAKIQDIDLGE